MSPAKLWLRIFFAGFAVIVALLLVTLFTPIPYGDLSRIGRVSDHEFGWRRPPPPLPVESMHSVPIDQADILVIGDSFSMTLTWQTALVKAGYRVTTIYWGQLPYLCKDFSRWVERAGFRGKLVVVESIERLVAERLDGGENCNAMQDKELTVKSGPFVAPLTQVPAFELNTTAKLTTGVSTYQNTQRAKELPDVQFGDRARVRTVPGGCDYFSHRLCDKVLFFPDDDKAVELSERTVRQMQAFNQAHPSPPILWMILPDKTTTYVEPNHSAGFVAALNKSKLGPDLFTAAREARKTMKDLYFPNDTHLSMHGQLWLGDLMLKAVLEKLGSAPRHAS